MPGKFHTVPRKCQTVEVKCLGAWNVSHVAGNFRHGARKVSYGALMFSHVAGKVSHSVGKMKYGAKMDHFVPGLFYKHLCYS